MPDNDDKKVEKLLEEIRAGLYREKNRSKSNSSPHEEKSLFSWKALNQAFKDIARDVFKVFFKKALSVTPRRKSIEASKAIRDELRAYKETSQNTNKLFADLNKKIQEKNAHHQEEGRTDKKTSDDLPVRKPSGP